MPPPRGSEPQSRGRPGWPIAVAVVAVVALVASLTMNVVQARRATDLREQITALDEQVGQLEQELADAREAGEDDADDDAGAGGLLDGLLGGEGGEGLDDLLGGLGGGDLGDLEGLLEGLLGGEGGGGLEDLLGGLGGAGQMELAQCAAGGPEPGSLTVPDAAAEEQIEVIAAQVEELRELTYETDVPTTFLDNDAFEQEVFERFEEDLAPEDADAEGRILAALGVIEPGTDVRELFLDLISGQAAGFYDTEEKEIFVKAVDPDAPLDTVTQITLAHELEHALADQNLTFPDLDADIDADAALANLAVIEGDAVLSQQQWMLGALSFDEQIGLAQDPLITDAQDQLAEFPHYMQSELLFPYEDGLGFICSVFNEGGWQAVNATYDDAPSTSAEILYPDRLGEAPADTPELGAPGGDWEEARTDTIGAAQLRWLFEAPGDDTAAALEEPAAAAAAWAGGELRLWASGDDSALGVSLAQRDDEPDLCASVTDWYAAAFPQAAAAGAQGDERLAVDGDAQSAVVSCGEDGVRLGIGPDLDVARAVAG